MTISETKVAEHYSDGGLLARILDALAAGGADIDALRPEDLAPVEEFHIGGREATAYATQKLGIEKSDHVLDNGCGIGGAARFMAGALGCTVSAIDLTPEYIDVARALSARTGFDGNPEFKVASAIDLPFDDAVFSAAITMHVAMNIAARDRMYGEAARVLKPGARFCAYDVMRMNNEPIEFPVPWSPGPETSHLLSAGEMKDALERAGFEVIEIEDRTEFSRKYFAERLAAAEKQGNASPGVHVIMGSSGPQRLKNVNRNIEAGRIAPVQMVARRL